MTPNDSAPTAAGTTARYPMRARPKLLARAALFAFAAPVLARATAAGVVAQEEGFHFTTEAAQATLFHTDPETGIVTEAVVYAADDQGYREKGQSGPPERVSKVFLSVTRYDPSCQGGGKLTAEAGGGGGDDPTCYGQSYEGAFPGKDGGSLPEDAFAVATPHLDGAWLTVALTLVTFDADGNSKLVESALSLAWTAVAPIETIHENELYHPDKITGAPRGTATVHVNSQQRQAAATGTLTLDGVAIPLSSTFAVIQDAKFRLT